MPGNISPIFQFVILDSAINGDAGMPLNGHAGVSNPV
jgi:hypothetical protein